MKALRSRRGNTIAELGPTLILVFIVFTFPLLAFATIMFRYVWVINAAHLASSQASRARGATWSTTKAAANTVLSNVFASNTNPGVTPVSSSVTLWVCPPSPTVAYNIAGPFVKNGQSLNQYVFNVDVTVNADIRPIIWSKGNTFGWLKIPGLTSPLNVSAASKSVIESQQGAF